MNFNLDKKGYNTQEVDGYIKNLTDNYEETLSNQKQRIFELKNALKEAENTIKAYKEKSSLVSKAIVSAVSKADEIERITQIKYNQEIEQLKAFHEKWMSYYNRILEKYPLDDDLLAASSFNSRMKTILARTNTNEPLLPVSETKKSLEKNYSDETERLKDKRIGYITVKASQGSSADDDAILKQMLPDGDLSSPILSGEFDPVERISKYFSGDKGKKEEAAAKDVPVKDDAAFAGFAPPVKKEKVYNDRSSLGFSFSEALNPKDDLSQIMKDLGLLLDE